MPETITAGNDGEVAKLRRKPHRGVERANKKNAELRVPVTDLDLGDCTRGQRFGLRATVVGTRRYATVYREFGAKVRVCVAR